MNQTGRPFGDEHFINKIESAANRLIRKKETRPEKKRIDSDTLEIDN
jgi:hypothetical protein